MTFKPKVAVTAAILALAGAAAIAQTVQINGAGATFPNPIYSKWFSEYNKLQPERADQLPVDRLGRRHPADHPRTVFFGATDGPMTPEQMQAAPGQDPAPADRARRRRAGLQHPGHQAELKFTGPLLADIYLGKITKWNDPAIAKLNAGVDAARHRHHRRAPLGRLGHDLHLGRLPVEGLAGVSEDGRRLDVGQVAGRRRRQGQRGRRRPGQPDPRLDRLRRADLRPPEQDRLRFGAEPAGKFVTREHRRR